MNISGPAAVAKPEMLFYAPGDLTVTKLLINEIAEQSGVPEQYVMYSSTYFGLAEEKSTLELLVIIGASSLIVLACSLVIYSLFYISVIGKTHEYGRLRVLGATSVQIKRIVRKESFCYPVLQFLSVLYWEVFWAIVSSRTAGIG